MTVEFLDQQWPPSCLCPGSSEAWRTRISVADLWPLSLSKDWISPSLLKEVPQHLSTSGKAKRKILASISKFPADYPHKIGKQGSREFPGTTPPQPLGLRQRVFSGGGCLSLSLLGCTVSGRVGVVSSPLEVKCGCSSVLQEGVQGFLLNGKADV